MFYGVLMNVLWLSMGFYGIQWDVPSGKLSNSSLLKNGPVEIVDLSMEHG